MLVNRQIFLILMIFALTGCNPFAKNSLVNIIEDLFTETTSFDLNNGGKTSMTSPASGNVNDAHVVKYKIGQSFSQQTNKTANGYTVETTMKGRR